MRWAKNSYLEGGDPAGSATMLSLIEQASAKCPSTELVIAGYRYFAILISISSVFTAWTKVLRHSPSRSQGAQLVHNAAAKLSAAIAAQIVAGELYSLQGPRYS